MEVHRGRSASLVQRNSQWHRLGAQNKALAVRRRRHLWIRLLHPSTDRVPASRNLPSLVYRRYKRTRDVVLSNNDDY
jgi:hypothetical protein